MTPMTDVHPVMALADSIDCGMISTLEMSASVAAMAAAAGAPAAVTDSGPVGVSIRVGVDLTEVAEVADSVRMFGDRYLRRIFTTHELECCRIDDHWAGPASSSSSPDRLPADPGTTGFSYESLAARFAAKEAAVKVLRPLGPRPDWRAIEVRRHLDGGCDLRLAGLAADLAEQAGFDHLAVSLTHHAGMGAAVVVAVRSGPELITEQDDHPDGAETTPGHRRRHSIGPVVAGGPQLSPPMHTHRTKE